jgi:probable HAF family extracellular repeat protein
MGCDGPRARHFHNDSRDFMNTSSTRRTGLTHAAIVFGALGAAASSMAAPPAYRIEQIGKSNGIRSQLVLGVSDNGNLLGCGRDVQTDEQFTYLKKSGRKAKPLAGTDAYCGTADVNDAGEVIANYASGHPGVHAALWTSDGQLHDLSELAGCDAGLPAGQASVGGLNEAGDVAFVVNCRINGQYQEHATLWQKGQVTFLAGHRPYVDDLNNRGQVVGTAVQPDDSRQLVIWEPDGSHRLLGTLGGSQANATSLNDAGHVVGLSTLATHAMRGFLYDGASIKELPQCGAYDPEPVKINNHGLIAARYGGGRENRHTGLIQDGRCYPLEDLLDASGGDWKNLSVSAMNNNGVIAGSGYFKGVKRNWIATPIAR